MSTDRPALHDLSPEQITHLVESWGEGPQRAWNLNRALFRTQIRSFDEIADLRRDLKVRLAREYDLPSLELEERRIAADGTEKYIFRLSDGERIETVMIPEVGVKAGTRAVCLSSQAGCALRCTFCRTGLMERARNLHAWEMIEQVREVARATGERVSHVVFMGMGEPLANYDALARTIETLIAPHGFAIAQRKITVSTSGLLPQMRKLAADFDVQIGLSLHASNDALRSQIMPINRAYPIAGLIEFLRSFDVKEQVRFMVEYILLDGVNNRPEHVGELAELLGGIRCQINLIPFNEAPGLHYARPTDAANLAFRDALRERGLNVSIRRSRGQEILGACGQLRPEKP